MSCIYSTPVIIKTPPPVAIPYHETPKAEGKHGHRRSKSQLTLGCIARFRSECEKHVIILDCIKASRDLDNPERKLPANPEQIEACYLRLTSWWESRSSDIDPDRVPSKENLLCA